MKTAACVIASLLFFCTAIANEVKKPASKNTGSVRTKAHYLYNPTDSIGYSGSSAICQGSALPLTANFAPAGSSFQWQRSIDNGATWSNIGTNSPGFTATQAGLYRVIVTPPTGSPVTYPYVAVTVNPLPVANFTSSPNGQCSSTPIAFTSTSLGSGLTYQWNFGDPASGTNNTSTLQNPVHHFVGGAAGGSQTFTVSLIVTNSFGCKDTTTATVNTTSPNTQLGGTGATTYNGLSYFSACVSGSSNFTFTNQSGNGNTAFTIIWGDGAPNFTATSFATVQHTYSVGNFPLQFIVTGANGCVDTATYYVFVGNNPAVGLNNPGNTFICSGTTLTFPVSGTANNTPGTLYTISFNDGSAPVQFTHPAPANVTHFFNRGSCGTNSQGFPNSFQATMQASNPCGTSAASVVPIYVSQKDSALFAILPGDTVCTTTPVTITNTSANNFGVTGQGVCLPGKGVWQITPATGWTLTSGSLGNDFGLSDPSAWQAGSTTINLTFSTPGTYRIRLRSGSVGICGSSDLEKTICVNPAPVANFALSTNAGCGPVSVTTTNNSNIPICGFNTYAWSVSYANTTGCTPATAGWSFLNGTNATSATPQFQFTNPGIYTVSLITRSPAGRCTSAPFTQQVVVKAKPQGTIIAPAAICQNGSISPSLTADNCFGTTAATYAWSFTGGTPATATGSNPGSIAFNTAGNQTISVDVTNECGTTTITKPLSVTAAPDVTVPANATFCAGQPTGGFSFSGSVVNTTYNWTNNNPAIGLAASGSGNIPNFTATNNTGAPITATITVTPVTGCTGTAQTFTITVNPRPAAPQISSPVIYCLNETATALTAVATGGNTLTWYNNAALNNGVTTPPTPSTTTAGNTTWWVTQTNSFNCVSPSSSITVTVHPLITGNTIVASQTICSGATPNPLSTQTIIGGGSGTYQYQWQVSNDGGLTWTNTPGATTAGYAPGPQTATVQYRRIVTSATCADTSNTVTITVQGILTNTGIAADQTICSGTAPALLTGQLPTGGNGTFSYLWESSLNNTAWSSTGATTQDYQPPVLTTTTYYRRRTVSGACTSFSAPVLITVNPRPMMTGLNNLVYCNNLQVTPPVFGSTPGTNTTYAWTNGGTLTGLGASGFGNLPAFLTTNTSTPKIPVTDTISVLPTFSANSVNCAGTAATVAITVLPTLTIAAIPDTVVCRGTSFPAFVPVHDAGAQAGSTVSFAWTITGSGTSLTNGTGAALPAFTTINNGTTDLVTTITITPRYTFSGQTCDGTPRSFTVTVKPGTPPSNAGRDTALCAATTYTLQGVLAAGTTGQWTQLGGPAATITNPALPNSTVTGLQPGNTYSFAWSLTGFAACAPSRDTVTIRVEDSLVNPIDTTTKTTCATQSITVTGNTPAGGNGTYQYQWQASADGVTWTILAGQTGISLTFVPTQTVYVRRFVTSLPCTNASLTALIVVQPPITNNTISASHAICVNTAAATLVGAQPSGGNNVFGYQWQQSSNNVTWTNIPGATAINYSPGVLTQTTFFRRLVTTTLCTGPQASTSNVVTITVNPDARALFLPTDTLGCVPYNLTAARINLQTFPQQNSQYLWYVNNTFLGSGNFPGFVMNNGGDTITIKLVAVSAFGCKNDSISRKFITFKVPNPSFTISDTVGCGPLLVSFGNTTPDRNSYSYRWDFGNGQIATQVQPGPVNFLPNPASGDTTYIIRMTVFSPCDTITVMKSVRVKAKPRALFTPNNSVGCSPMTVVFNNTSLGLNNSYTWHFGDGSAPVSTSATGAISHTFVTGVRDTFFVKLVAQNECGRDSLTYAIVVAPNAIRLDVAVNGNQQSGCAPHRVAFINNSAGASAFTWNFGDGSVINTSRNIDTVYHTFLQAGTYVVNIRATNGCSDTSTTETIIVYPRPRAQFTANKYVVCIGDSVRFTNTSDSATSYFWQFGDGNTSVAISPSHTYTTPGLYNIKLTAFRFNAPGSVCTDSVIQQVRVVASLPGTFTVSDSIGRCTPFTVTFSNQSLPAVTTTWDFGDGNSGTGNVVQHTYTRPGVYLVQMTATAPGGCQYTSTRTIRIVGPAGTWTHSTGYLCRGAARFSVNATNTDTLVYNFGDGNTLTTVNNIVFHTYANAGVYFPTVQLKNTAGCAVVLQGNDSIRIERMRVGFTATQQKVCGATTVAFRDTSLVFFGKQSARWDFGDNTTGTGFNVVKTYTASGTYPVQLIVTGNSGCQDTVVVPVTVQVNNIPRVAISGDSVTCVNYNRSWIATIQSTDALTVRQWSLSNGVTATGTNFNYTFTQAGNYTLRFIAGTVNGCFDTLVYNIRVNPSPTVAAPNDITLCRGSSAPLTATGVGVSQWSWSPLQGLSCYNCPNPIASPLITTPYLVQGTNGFGCSATDTVVVTVIQPLRMTVSPNDSICINTSTQIVASGAASYNWTPAAGLSSTTISNPVASPTNTTRYRVVGYDGFNCFTDTAFVLVAVGQQTTISLGPDVTMAAGTQFPLRSTITNGPIRSWNWQPSANLSCSTCPLPTLNVKNDATYIVNVTSVFGCTATDTINIKAFCESAQVFIPNAFTPDGDGVNDVLMVRGTGIAMVKTFRIFNRWGEVVFERANFPANNLSHGWNGLVKGVPGGPDVYVYTAEVLCENGSSFTYKGNVSIIK